MRRILLVLACVISFNEAYGQGWGADIGLGLSYARLLRSAESTKQTENIRYSFGQPGICISPEIFLTLNEHSRVIFSYQLSENKTGIQFRAGRGAGSHEYNYEQFQLHNFSVGYCHFRNIAHEKVSMGLLLKVGIANGLFIGGGYGESGSGSTQGYVQTLPVSSDKIMSSFWMPDATIGITLSPRFEWSPLIERITLSSSLTAGFKDIYTDYSKVQYSIYTDKGIDKGTAQYKGSPLLLQFIVCYRLFMRERES